MKEKIMKWLLEGWQWIKGSGDNKPEGASSKKLTGFWFIVILTTPVVYTWLHWAYKNNDWNMLPYVLTTIVGAGLAALGIGSLEKTRLAKIEKGVNVDKGVPETVITTTTINNDKKPDEPI